MKTHGCYNIVNFIDRYNGILGEYPTNSQEITKTLMSKFLDYQRIARTPFPDIASESLLQSVRNNTLTRGTLQATGQDIEEHANGALALCAEDLAHCLNSGVMIDSIELGKSDTMYMTSTEYNMVSAMYRSIFPCTDTL